jgi:hypothetical protein
MSDGTHLTKFTANKIKWPAYMTIGNLFLKIRQMPSMHIIVMVALLLIGMKNCNHPEKRLDEQRQSNREALNEVLQFILQHRTFKQNPSTESGN